MEQHLCTEVHRINRLEADVRDLKDADKKHSEDISDLKEGQAESRIFQKLILDQLAEIKAMVSSKKSENSTKEWMELLKWVLGGTIIAIVTWMISSNLGG